MRNQRVKTLHPGLALGALVGGAFLAHAAFAQTAPAPVPLFGPAVTPGRQLQLSDFTATNPLIPDDIYRNSNAVDHRDLATFAWLEFISAVAPNAGAGQRGVPGGTFASTATPGAGPLVWETYQHRSELFPCNIGTVDNKAAPVAVPPQPWGAPPTYAYGNATAFGVPPTACTTVTSPGAFNNLDETSEIGQNFLFFPLKPGSPNPAVDGQVLFEAKANQVESNFIAANYQSLNSTQYPNPFYLTPAITLPTGTVEVKAAWRPLSSIPPSQWYRYHIANALVYSGNANPPTPASEPYALVALHIIHKTANYPAFIFATFEQVDDYRNQAIGGSPTQLYYVPTYTTIAYATPAKTTFPPLNQMMVDNPSLTVRGQPFNTQKPLAAPNDEPVKLPVGLVSGIQGAKAVPGGMYAVPVAAPVKTVQQVDEVNNRALDAMHALPGFSPNFVWQYYHLVGVQAVPTNDETSADFYLANIVVESSQPGIQLFRGFPPINGNTLTNNRNQVNVLDHVTTPPGMTSSGGCQGCHGIAQTQQGSDFSFLFAGVGGGGFTPDAIGLPHTAAELAAHLSKRKYLK